jgi:hypothetical protein
MLTHHGVLALLVLGCHQFQRTSAVAISPVPVVGLVAAPCFHDASGFYQVLQPRQKFVFDFDKGGAVTSAGGSSCLTAVHPNLSGSPLAMMPCVAGSLGQDWDSILNLTTGTLKLRHGAAAGLQNGGLTNAVLWLGPGTSAHFDSSSGTFSLVPRAGFNDAVGCGRGCAMCVTAGPPVRPCDKPSPAAAFPMCDAALPLAQRVADLVMRIPQNETEKLLDNIAGAVPSLWIQRQNWWSEALHGVQSGCAHGAGHETHCPVSFPAAISTSASFNSTLFHAVGDAVGTEARALSNVGAADGYTFWSPVCVSVPV